MSKIQYILSIVLYFKVCAVEQRNNERWTALPFPVCSPLGLIAILPVVSSQLDIRTGKSIILIRRDRVIALVAYIIASC